MPRTPASEDAAAHRHFTFPARHCGTRLPAALTETATGIDHVVTGRIEGTMLPGEGTSTGGAKRSLAPGDCMASPAPKAASMTGAAFKTRLRDLGRSHSAFALEIGVSLRSVDRWASSGPPPEVAYLVDLLATLEHRKADRPADHPSFPDQLDRLMEEAASQGRLIEFVMAARNWYANRHFDDFEG